MNFWSSQVLRAKVAGAIVAAISLGGFAVAAAAVVKEPAPHVVSASDVTTSPPTDPTVTDTTTTPTDPPVTVPATDPPVTDPTTAPATVACMNHGERVSKVAHETDHGPGHGAAVSQAAHDHEGECNKADEADPPPTSATTDDATDDADDQPPTVVPTAPANAVQTGGHGHDDHHGGNSGD